MIVSMVFVDGIAFTISWSMSILIRLFLINQEISFFKFGYSEGLGDFLYFFYLFSFFGVMVLFFFFRGLYPGIQLGVIEEIRRIEITISLVFFLTLSFSFFVRIQNEYSRLLVGGIWLFSSVLIPVFRSFSRALFVKLKLWGEPIAIMGNKQAIEKIVDHLNRNPKLGFNPEILINRGTLKDDELNQITRAVKRSNIRTIIYAGKNTINFLDIKLENAIIQLFERPIFVNTNFFDQMLWVSICDLGGMMGFEHKKNLNNLRAKFIKRSFDIGISLIGLLILSPLFLIIILLIKLDSKGPILYNQIRIGKGCSRFVFYKFRTMHVNADEVLEEQLLKNPNLKSEWSKYQKLKEDPRITRIGKILRRFSLDELPQLVNVIKGDMSLAGPRPFMENQLELYGTDLANYILVRPGLTGMWQVSGRNKTTFHRRVQFDNYYVRNWSVWLDFYIIIRTIFVIFEKDEAY